MQTQLFTPDNFARRFTVKTNEGVIYSRDLINNVLNDCSKLIIGFFPIYFKDFTGHPIITTDYNEETLVQNGTVNYELFINNTVNGKNEKAIEIKLSKLLTKTEILFQIEVTVLKLNDILMSAMLSGNVESSLFVSKLNYKKEPL